MSKVTDTRIYHDLTHGLYPHKHFLRAKTPNQTKMKKSAVSLVSHLALCSSPLFVYALDNDYLMPQIFPQYINQVDDTGVWDFTSEKGDFFVFLQKFPLWPIDIFYHTEVVVCNKDKFSTEQIKLLDAKIAGMKDFAEIDKPVWKDWSMPRVELGYGASFCDTACCSVPHGADQLDYPLNAKRAVIMNAETKKKQIYIYGSSDISGDKAYHDVCDHKCWSDWKGTDYNLILNNCNTFTSTVLSCVYGLSEKKPDLNVSDMIDVTCRNKYDTLYGNFEFGSGETTLL